MSTTYTQKQSTAQKKDAPFASSVLDASSQGESLQRKADMANNAAQRVEVPRPNNTGMPDNLKAGIESLSGFSMDDVRVHYNSSKPATVQALAYTQGSDIHVAPGQEKCLPHEAWHVAQQMAGRVSPTTNINGMPVNDNAALEHEADVMGEKAVQCKFVDNEIKRHYQGVQRNICQLFDPDFTYKASVDKPPAPFEKENFSYECILDAVEQLFDGIESLYMDGNVNTLKSYIKERYKFSKDGDPENSIRTFMDDNVTDAMLLLYKKISDVDETFLYYNYATKEKFTFNMIKKLKILPNELLPNERCKDALDTIYSTAGMYAETEVNLGSDVIVLLDEDNFVIGIDSHQNKHQTTLINGFETQYQGAPGSKFSKEKNLEWHKANSAQTVKNIMGNIFKDDDPKKIMRAEYDPRNEDKVKTYCIPKKQQEDGYIYDLCMYQDLKTGKYVGTYHCNPIEDEI